MESDYNRPEDIKPVSNLDLGSGLGEQRWWRSFISLCALICMSLWMGTQFTPKTDVILEQAPVIASDNSVIPPLTANGTSIDKTNRIQEQESQDAIKLVTLVIGKGDTLGDLLAEHKVDANEAYDVVKAMSSVYSPKKLKLGQRIKLELAEENADPALRSLTLKTDFGRELLVQKDNDGNFHASEHEMAIESRPVYREGIIEDSLYLSGERVGIPPSVLIELIQIYSFSVDFQREIRKGDSFKVLFEEWTAEDGEVTRGPISFAELKLRDEAKSLYRFTPPDDKRADYFSPDGKSTRRLLMKTPIDGARLSSRFGKRKHPVLGYVKSHRGTDFAAPTGTPIYAAGDGVVERASRYGSYGNYVRIRHNGTYKTAYAHLSKYGRGIRKGKRVKQGQIIGYVGATGRVTGAHLHYEVLQNDKRVNPLSLKLPSGRDLKGDMLASFAQERDIINSQLYPKRTALDFNDSLVQDAGE